MDGSTENQKEIINCYQALVNAREKLHDYDANREFADFAPKYTETNLDGTITTLQQLRSSHEDVYKKCYKWATYITFERWDMHGDQITTVLFMRDEILIEAPSDVAGKRKIIPHDINQVCKDTWINTDRGWKLFRSHQLHAATWVKEAEYISSEPDREQPDLQFEADVMRAYTLGKVYGLGARM